MVQPSLASRKEIVKTPNFIGKDIDRAILKVHNHLRTNPKSFLPWLENRLERFDGNVYQVEDDDLPDLMTAEGPKAVQEAIDFLK